jgi:hypothetical protein
METLLILDSGEKISQKSPILQSSWFVTSMVVRSMLTFPNIFAGFLLT